MCSIKLRGVRERNHRNRNKFYVHAANGDITVSVLYMEGEGLVGTQNV